MSRDAYSVVASASSSRCPALSFSAMGRSAGSDRRLIGNSSGAMLTAASLAVLSHGERHVVPAEPEAVAERVLDVAMCRLVRRVVEIALWIRVRIVDRRRDHAVANHERADDEFQRARGAEHV